MLTHLVAIASTGLWVVTGDGTTGSFHKSSSKRHARASLFSDFTPISPMGVSYCFKWTVDLRDGTADTLHMSQSSMQERVSIFPVVNALAGWQTDLTCVAHQTMDPLRNSRSKLLRPLGAMPI